MLDDILVKLGFSLEESRCYLALLEHGAQTGGSLAKLVGMPRPTVYGYAARLVDRGLASQSLQHGFKKFLAEPPEKLRILYQHKIEALQRQEKTLDTLIPALVKQASLSALRPTMRFYAGQEGIQNLMEDILHYKNIESHTIWPIQSMLDVITPEFLRYHNKMRIRRQIAFKSIWHAEQAKRLGEPEYLGTGDAYLREIRISPPTMDFRMGAWYYANKAIFIASSVENFGFMIESAELVELLEAQFHLLWAIATPYSIKPKGAKTFLKETTALDGR
jgi:predicted transcriptional regulator